MSSEAVSVVDKVLPDFLLMKKVKNQAFDLSDEWLDDILPAIAENLQHFKSLLLDAERALHENLVACNVMLENRGYGLPAGRERTISNLSSTVSLQQKYWRMMADHFLQLELYTMSAISEQLSRLEAEAQRHHSDLESVRNRQSRLLSEHGDIVQALEVFNRPSVFSAFKGMIPSDGEVDAIVGLITDPKVDKDTIKTVTRKLTQHVELLEGARSFKQLADVRTKLERKIAETRSLVDDIARRSERADSELKAHQALAGIQPLKAQWLEQARKLENEWGARAIALVSMADRVTFSALESLFEYIRTVHIHYMRTPD
ncbi:hypothetical protein D3C81_880100 [compost metagenome]